MEFILSPNDNLPPEYYLSALLAQEVANETLKEALSDPGSMCFNSSVHCTNKTIHLFFSDLSYNVLVPPNIHTKSTVQVLVQRTA